MRTYGLIGYPLGHSFSQRYFTEKFSAGGMTDCRYLNFPIPSIGEVVPLIAAHPDLEGFNVTIPYKQQIIPYLAGLSDEAREAGAVNCVRITPQGSIGYNTDMYGFALSLDRLLGPDRPEKVLILGTGGASRAVRYVLSRRGIPFSSVSRNPDGGDYTYACLTPEIVSAHRLIVNATPLGTFPATDGFPDIPYEGIGSGHYLFDLVYNPPLTQFLRRGADRGAATTNGYDMLVGQAEKAWEIWNTGK